MKRHAGLVACAVVLGGSTVAFNLLYLFVPHGLKPVPGFARDISHAYARWLPAAVSRVALAPAEFARASAVLQVAMWGAFLIALAIVARLRDGEGERATLRLVVIASGAIAVALLLTPPTLSIDLYHYALFGRMIVTRHLNPYITPGDALAGHPLWRLAGWRDFTTHYGPVFTDLSVVAAWVGVGDPVGTALAFKGLSIAGGVLTAWSAAGLAREGGHQALLPVVFVAWNPVALIETAGSGHNEMVMTGLALAGLLLVRRGRTNLGFALLVASIHVKWVTAALAGLVVIAQLYERRGVRARAVCLVKLIGVAVSVTVAVYLPFWAGWRSVSASRRLITAARPGGLSLGGLLLFAAVVIAASIVVARSGHRWVLEMAAIVSLGFVMFVFPWAFPWYLLPALAFLAVGPVGRLNGALQVIVLGASMFLMGFWAVLVPAGRSSASPEKSTSVWASRRIQGEVGPGPRLAGVPRVK